MPRSVSVVMRMGIVTLKCQKLMTSKPRRRRMETIPPPQQIPMPPVKMLQKMKMKRRSSTEPQSSRLGTIPIPPFGDTTKVPCSFVTHATSGFMLAVLV